MTAKQEWLRSDILSKGKNLSASGYVYEHSQASGNALVLITGLARFLPYDLSDSTVYLAKQQIQALMRVGSMDTVIKALSDLHQLGELEIVKGTKHRKPDGTFEQEADSYVFSETLLTGFQKLESNKVYIDREKKVKEESLNTLERVSDSRNWNPVTVQPSSRNRNPDDLAALRERVFGS